ncbi:MAG: fibronectin type III domain-containing protein, partial [Candidatus Cloacimonetes bacterium]|nr:fibronectin type III domain-containing protein [Candidatus Cloacimonadota bacterium]
MRLSPTAGTIRVALSVLWMLPLTGTLRAEIVNESGSLREFLAGSEPGAAYDNWVSHVAEAISRPGYNMYAPPALDTQLNGFGGFQVLEDNAPDTAILQLFRDLADALLNGDSAAADLLLQNGPAIDYDLVRFTDTGLGREYWMLREQLDASFTDPGLDPGILDDVVGSFVHGWGLFIFCPQASRPEIVVQVPHPCDDYLSPYIALEFFLEADAGLMMLNGAGREVAHRNETFSNDTSLSDPTRNCEHPFAVIHEQLVDHWQELGQEELVVQVHSYDDLAHRDLKSCVVVGGRYNRIHNPVLVDTGGGSKGLFTNLLQPVFAEDELGFSHDEWRIQDYMSSNQLYPVIVSGGIPDSSLTLSIAPELWGYGESCQWNYTYPDHGDGYPECDAGERAIHIEIDELPTPAHDLGETEYYHITPPAVASWHNFTTAWAFARPVFDNLLVARDSLRAFVDDTAPTTPTNLRVSGFTASSLRIGWRPTLSDRFDTYEVLVDTAATIGPTARLVNNSEEDELCWPGTRQVVIHGLDLLTVYSIGIRARDAQGRVSELSNIVQGMPDDLDAPLVTLPPETTGFSGGVIPVSAEIVDETGVQQATLQWDTGSGWQNVVMENLSGNIWVGSLAPLAPGTVAQLQVIAVDASGHDNTATSSPGILSVMHDLYADGFNGTSDWTHAAFGGNVDQWHLSTTRHSEGTHAWKFGSTGAADYANNAAGWLTSPEYLVPIGASQVRVQFSSWVEAETSGSQPDSCYDGGVVDVSLADGEWQPA